MALALHHAAAEFIAVGLDAQALNDNAAINSKDRIGGSPPLAALFLWPWQSMFALKKAKRRPISRNSGEFVAGSKATQPKTKTGHAALR
jgi:hypothetical protein